MTDVGPRPARWFSLIMQAIIPILLIGLVLPIGLVMLVLWLDGTSTKEAVERGEMFLAAANAGLTASLILLLARPDRFQWAIGLSVTTMGILVLPCYVAWAQISTAEARDDSFSADSAFQGGTVALIAGLLIAAFLVVFAFYAPPPRAGRSTSLDRLP